MTTHDIDPVFRSSEEEERYQHEMDNPPDTCVRCIHWRGDEFTEYGECPVIRMEVSGSATCTRFEAKAEV